MKRFAYTASRVLSAAARLNGDIYHIHDPELLLWAFLSPFRKIHPLVYDAHEDFSAAIRDKTWISPMLRRSMSLLAGGFERFAAHAVTESVICAWPGIQPRFSKHSRSTVINNYCWRNELDLLGASASRDANHFVYAGLLAPGRGILHIIEAVAMLDGRARLTIAGPWSGRDFEDSCRSAPGWRHTKYVGILNREGMRQLFATASVGILAYLPLRNHLYSVPNKIFEYMSGGLAVIASDLPMQRQIITQSGGGVCADPTSPKALAEAMLFMLENPEKRDSMAMAGRQAVVERFCWENEWTRLLEFYLATLAKQPFRN